jgi:hypothetical protein
MAAKHRFPFIPLNRPQRSGQNDLVFATGKRRGGLCSPAVFEMGQKIGIDLLDLRTFTRKRLATLKPETSSRLATEHWLFDEAVM